MNDDLKTLYLCGGINGLSDAAAMDWRERTKERLSDRYQILDPMRRDYRGREDQSVLAIVAGDLEDIVASDVLLVMANRPSWGTAMEVWEARRHGKRIVVVCDAERVSPWLRYCADLLLPDLEAALSYLFYHWRTEQFEPSQYR